MKVDLGIWEKLTWLVTILALIAGVTLVAGWYLPLIKQNERMRQDILNKSESIQQEEATNRNLKASIEALQHDPKTVERLVREKLGYAKPGETVVRFEQPLTNNASN